MIMRTLNKHPAYELLASYSAGSLPLSQALCVSAHLEHCHSCTRQLQQLNHVGSELMQELKPASLSSDLKTRLFDSLDSLDEAALNAMPETTTKQSDPSVPRCLQQFIVDNYADLAWKRVSTDIHSVELCRDANGAKVELLKIKPGGSASQHTHLGDEYTVILEGSFSDESGLYQQGDFIVKDSRDRHKPVATLDKPCICLAVSEGPIQFTGFFTRLLNPLLRRSYALKQLSQY